MLEQLSTRLISSAQAQPQVFVHRDYHCRNVMVLADQSLATIDFQDAVIGPISYDLVSLLRDCYVAWPEHKVSAWLEHYRQQLLSTLAIEVSADEFRQWFDLMGLHRHIKVLGVFARLSHRDGKHGYVDDLPQVMAYVIQVAAQHAQQCRILAEFHQWLQQKIMPLIEQQDWGKKCTQLMAVKVSS